MDCADAIQELNLQLAELYENKFDMIATDYENQLALLEHLTNTYNNGLADLEERGYFASTKYYEALRDVAYADLATQKQQLNDLTVAMSEAVNSGYIKEGSEAWYEMQESINGVKEAIQESETAVAEFTNAIRETRWGYFDYLQEQISNITDEAEFLIDLMSNTDLYTDNGQLTDTGESTMGLHGQNYNVYMAQADKYAEEILKLDKEIATDPYNTKLLERREELLRAQRDSILAAEDEKQAIVDMVEEGINLELDALRDLIDTYKESLDSEKNLYEYQKKIRDQTSEIGKLQKQLSAYSNDDSEETRATKQRIEVELKKAQDELEETEYDNFITEQKKLLDALYDEYESVLNMRLDNIDLLISDMIDRINANASLINDTLISQADNVGYTISEAIRDIWSNDSGALSIITKYGDNFTSMFTSVNEVLNGIALKVQEMINFANAMAQQTVQQATSSTPSMPDVMPPVSQGSMPSMPETYSPPASSAPAPSAPAQQDFQVGDTVYAGNAPIYDSSYDSPPEHQYFSDDPYYVVLGENNGYVLTRWHGTNEGFTGWFKKEDLMKYKQGGLVDYTGIAQLDGSKRRPEAVLNPKDTANFIALKDAMQQVASGKSPLSALFGKKLGTDNLFGDLAKTTVPETNSGVSYGDIVYEVNIPIDHVEDYEDFANQMRKDGKFEKLIQSMTVSRLAGGSKISKNKYQW